MTTHPLMPTAYNTGLPASFAALTSPNLASVPVLAASPGSAGWSGNGAVVEEVGEAGQIKVVVRNLGDAAPVGKRRSSPSDRPGSATQDVS